MNESGASTAIATKTLPAEMLSEGEIIIMTRKPSPWFILLVSWQVLAMAGILLLALWAARSLLNMQTAVSADMIFWVCAAVAGGRLFIACVQWGGRLYILTNLRVISIRGAFRPEFFQCPLKNICQVTMSATLGERILAVGSLTFLTRQGHRDFWMHISRPAETRRIAMETISKLT